MKPTSFASTMPVFAVTALSLGTLVVGLGFFPARAATETVLWNFEYSGLGHPAGRLLLQNGALLGTAQGDETGKDDGQAFELKQSGSAWKINTLWYFQGANGSTPIGGLIRDSKGNLYGTTSYGGTDNDGAVYELSESGGKWLEQILWNFGSSSSDGTCPMGELVMDASGNLYGTTFEGGSAGSGTVFELSKSGGSWKETILHSFAGGRDGMAPLAGLLIGPSGSLYGTTPTGGGNTVVCPPGCGTVFALTNTGTAWSEQILHRFGAGSSDGEGPQGSLVMNSDGVIFGTTLYGGGGAGTVFSLTKTKTGWKESQIYIFGDAPDGQYPYSALTWGSNQRTLYGTTDGGGSDGKGTVFELDEAAGNWYETVLHSFSGADGRGPYATVIRDNSGNLYGTTVDGGTFGNGTVFEVTP